MRLNINWTFLVAIGLGLVVALMVYGAVDERFRVLTAVLTGIGVTLFAWGGLGWFGGAEPTRTTPTPPQDRR